MLLKKCLMFDMFQGKKGAAGAAERKRIKNPNIRAPGSKPKNIRSMFAAAAGKAKPKVEVCNATRFLPIYMLHIL